MAAFEELYSIHNSVLNSTPVKAKRYLYSKIHWSSKALCITGARGVGKTTLLLQYCAEKYQGDSEKCLYISADNVYITANGLFKTVSEYFRYGGLAVIIDEVHKYSDWSLEVKNIIDSFPSKQILISGSSALNLKTGKGDLSRRVVYYDLQGLSFREYLNIKYSFDIEPLSLESIIANHVKTAKKINSLSVILKHFKEYLNAGYYPYCFSDPKTYLQRLANVVEKVIYEDIAGIYSLKNKNIPVLKRILWLIASSPVFYVNIEKMSRDLGISKEIVYNYLDFLERADLINALRSSGKGFKFARKPEKLFMENTNLSFMIMGQLNANSPNIGTIRETFFVNQLKQAGNVATSGKGDFLIDNKFVFEVGGSGKNYQQIKGINDSYLACDNIDIGFGNKIPLYLFGFLY